MNLKNNLKNRLSVKIEHTSPDRLTKLENLHPGEDQYATASAAFKWHLGECHEVLKECLIELQKK